MSNKKKIAYLIRSLVGGGNDIQLESYLNYNKIKNNFDFYVFVSNPVDFDKSVFNEIKRFNKIIYPTSIEILFLDNFFVPLLSLLLFIPRIMLSYLIIKKNKVNYFEFNINVKKKLYFLLLFIKIVYFNIKFNFDVFHSIGVKLDGILFRVLIKLNNLRIIHSESEDPININFYKKTQKYLLLCQKIIVPSQRIKDNFKFKFPLVSNSNLQIIPFFSKNELIKKTPLKIFGSKVVFGSMGRLHKEKGIEMLIKSLYEVKKQSDNWMLILAGDGEEKNNLFDLVNNLNLSNNIKFLGWTKEIDYFFKEIDVFIHTSLSESGPIVIIEALSYSKPIISTDVGSVQDMIDDSSGFIIPVNSSLNLIDKILFFINNNDKIIQMGEHSREIFEENFYSEINLNKTYNLYQEVLSEKRKN